MAYAYAKGGGKAGRGKANAAGSNRPHSIAVGYFLVPQLFDPFVLEFDVGVLTDVGQHGPRAGLVFGEIVGGFDLGFIVVPEEEEEGDLVRQEAEQKTALIHQAERLLRSQRAGGCESRSTRVAVCARGSGGGASNT